MADNQTFEQWLEAQSNLTDAQRQALIAHNADATVTFSPESFDRYLTELREQGSEPRGGKANADNSSEADLQTALAMANGDLSKMDYEQVAAVWNTLNGIDGNAAPELSAKASEAKAKMAEFSERLMAGVNLQQPWTMDTAPEYTSWLEVNKAVLAQSNDTANKEDLKRKLAGGAVLRDDNGKIIGANSKEAYVFARNEQIQSSLISFYQAFDREHGLDKLTEPAHVQMLKANEAAVLAIGKDFNPFAKNEQGELRHPEFAAVDKFYDKLDIDNSNKNVDAVNKDSLKKDMAELAFNETLLQLSMNPDFARLSKEQQEKLLAETYAFNMQAGMITMIAAQMAEQATKEDQNPHKVKEFEDQAAQYITAAVKGENNSFKVSNTAALANLASRTTTQEHIAKRVAQKTGHKSFWQKIKDFDERMAKKHPKAYPFLKNLAISSSVGLAFGGAGLAVMSVYKTGKAIQKSWKNYKESNKDGQYKSYFGYLRKNPKEIIGLGVSLAGSVMSAYMVGMNGISVSDFGLGGQVYENGLSNTWDMMKNTVGNAFSSPEAAKDLPWTERATSWGKKFLGQVTNTTQDGNRATRLLISLGGGLSTGAIDFAASFKEKDPEKRKQLRKNAWKAASGAFIGAGISLGFTGFMKANNPDSPLPHDSPVDSEDFKPQDQPTKDWDANHNGIPDSIERPAEQPVDNTIKSPWASQEQTGAETEPKVTSDKEWDANHNGIPDSIERPSEQPVDVDNMIKSPWANQEQAGTEAEPEVAPDENMEFWKNRADKFLGEENTKHIYDMVERGEIKLPDGIESKEEYAYKLAMDIQQTPAEINQALGGEWKSSAKLTDSIKSWTAEDFAKLNDSVDDFSDRGYHNGEIPGRNPVNSTGGGKSPDTIVLDGEQHVLNPGHEPDKTPKPSQAPVAPAAEDIRDEAYYQEEKDALGKHGDEKSLKSQINAARKDENVTVEEAIDTFMDNRVAAGDMSEQQGTETANLVKHELDGRDGNQDGKINDEELSKRDVRRGMKEVNRTLDAMKENADEVLTAENLQGGFEVDAEHPDTYTSDTRDPKFYEGASKVVHEMRSGDQPIQDVMKEAVVSGEITKEQATLMNTRYAELRREGLSDDASLRQMERDFDRMAKYHEAQNFGSRAQETSNEISEPAVEAKQEPVATQTEEKAAEVKEEPVVTKTEEKAAEVKQEPVETKTEEKSELQKRLDEAKERFGVPVDDGQTVPAENTHTLPNGGSYEVTENGISVRNARVLGQDNEFRKFTKVATGGNTFLNGEDLGRGMRATMMMNRLALNEQIYDDMHARQVSGAQLTEIEKGYMSKHEEDLAKYGLAHDEKGNVVKQADNTSGKHRQPVMGRRSQGRND